MINLRGLDEFTRFFDGLALFEPGVRSVAEWRAAAEPQPRPSRSACTAGSPASPDPARFHPTRPAAPTGRVELLSGTALTVPDACE